MIVLRHLPLRHPPREHAWPSVRPAPSSVGLLLVTAHTRLSQTVFRMGRSDVAFSRSLVPPTVALADPALSQPRPRPRDAASPCSYRPSRRLGDRRHVGGASSAGIASAFPSRWASTIARPDQSVTIADRHDALSQATNGGAPDARSPKFRCLAHAASSCSCGYRGNAADERDRHPRLRRPRLKRHGLAAHGIGNGARLSGRCALKPAPSPGYRTMDLNGSIRHRLCRLCRRLLPYAGDIIFRP